MRTTLTIDDDVAADLARLQKQAGQTWKQIVNDVLRSGLASLEATSRRRAPVARTRSVRLGRSLVGDVSNVHEVLSLVEGEARR